MQPVLCTCVNRVETVLFKQLVWKGIYGMITCLQGLVVPMAHPIPVRVSKCTLSQHSDPILFNGICESRILGWNLCYAWMHNQKGINQWHLAEMMGTYGMVTCLQCSAVPMASGSAHYSNTLILSNGTCESRIWRILGLHSNGYSSLLMPSHFTGRGGLGVHWP